MYNEIREKLEQEVETELDILATAELDGDEFEKQINGLTKLVDRVIKMEELEISKVEKEKQFELEAKKAEEEMSEKQKQRRDELIDKITKNTLTGVSVVGGFALTVWGTIKTIKFEETGTVTTILGRGFFNKLLHK